MEKFYSYFLFAGLGIDAIYYVFIGLGALIIGFLVGFLIKKVVSKKKIDETQAQINKMLEDAHQQSKAIKKEAILEAKEQELMYRRYHHPFCRQPPQLRKSFAFPMK